MTRYFADEGVAVSIFPNQHTRSLTKKASEDHRKSPQAQHPSGACSQGAVGLLPRGCEQAPEGCWACWRGVLSLLARDIGQADTSATEYTLSGIALYPSPSDSKQLGIANTQNMRLEFEG